jgi:acyl carrier protein
LEPKAALAPRTAIRDFLNRLLARDGEPAPFSDEDSLLLSGRLQSVDGVEIVVFLEEQYGLDFAAMGFDLAKIDSVNAISALIDAKRAATYESGNA